MEILGPAAPKPTDKELIALLSKPIARVMSAEMADESDIDRIWLLRKYHKAYLYYRDLAYFAPALYQGLVDSTGVDGSILPETAWQGTGVYDYTQNQYRGYCRKFEAVLGTRIPNATAVPNDPSDEKDIKAARAANNAAMYVRQKNELQVMTLWLAFKLFNFGTSFWSMEWVVDGAKYGYKTVPQYGQEDVQMGGGFNCPQCGASHDLDDPGNPTPPPNCAQCGSPMDGASFQPPFSVPAPSNLPPKQVPKGALEIDILDGTEVSVPLDADGRQGVDDCRWIDRYREKHKSYFLAKHGDVLRETAGEDTIDEDSASNLYGRSVRSSMASPIGLVRPQRENYWSERTADWTPDMYEMVDEKDKRQALKDNYPLGIRITIVKGRIVKLENRKITAHWQECQPEPTQRIMADSLGDDWIITNDLLNNTLNQQNEAIERSNEPGFADATRVDLDAYQRRRDNPGDLIPAIPPAGKSLSDIIYRPPALTGSPEIPPFRSQVEQTSQQNSGLLEVIWGGDTSDPTARQTELKTNAAIRQLSVMWVMMGKSLERVYEKSCNILADNADGILSFSKQKANEYGKFDTVAVVIEDLKGGNYHFEADEAIPMTWGQQRDLLMWMLDKPADILKAWGLGDPMNIFEFKELLGMPGMRVPNLASRDKGMDIISRLLNAGPVPGPANPDGTPGPKQPSIQPSWEDDGDFLSKLVKDYLTDNFELQEQNPNGYENVLLYGQAQEKRANVPPPPPPVKGNVTTTLKGSDIGSAAIQSILQKEGILPPGVPVQQEPPLPRPTMGPSSVQ